MLAPCRIGYRTFGTLRGDNAVLVPTWFTGTSKDLAALIPGRFVDPQRYFVVLVDALANGVSSAPSNQGRLQFPHVEIRDMVRAQRQLLDQLGIRKLHAVVGISMGGMQAIEWSVTYPDAMDRVVAIVGSPQLGAQDLLLWTAQLRAIENDPAYAAGAYRGHPNLRAATDIQELVLFTPEYRAAHTSRTDFPAWLAAQEAAATFDWNDRRRQLEAMLTHDVGKPYGSLDAAAARVRAKSLYLLADRDHVVSPAPARAFGEKVHAVVESTASECGHLAAQVCETDAIAARVSAFLAAD